MIIPIVFVCTAQNGTLMYLVNKIIRAHLFHLIGRMITNAKNFNASLSYFARILLKFALDTALEKMNECHQGTS